VLYTRIFTLIFRCVRNNFFVRLIRTLNVVLVFASSSVMWKNRALLLSSGTDPYLSCSYGYPEYIVARSGAVG
jgi:hypothetical protein